MIPYMTILTKINFRHGAQGYAKPKKGRDPKMGVLPIFQNGDKANFASKAFN